VQPGDELLVYAQLAEEAVDPVQRARLAQVSLSGPVQHFTSVALAPVSRPLLERSLMRAYLQELQQSLGKLDGKTQKDAAAALKKQIVSLSTRFRVLSEQTALLVLETDEDYARHGIDRTALADILTVGERGLVLLQRPALAAKNKPTDKQTASREKPEFEAKLRRTGPMGGEQEGLAPPSDSAMEPPPPGSARPALSNPDAVRSLFDGPSGMGREDNGVLGGLVGESGQPLPSQGFGLVGKGAGGGGTGEGTIGLGNLGTIGGGARGSGSRGYGAASRGPRGIAGEVMQGMPAVQGSLDRELIRRIVRHHQNELRYCYELALQRSPALQGRLMVRFVIDMQGNVVMSTPESSTANNPQLEACVTQAVRRWQFPRPQGSLVVVEYPFVFVSGDGRPSRPEPPAPPFASSDDGLEKRFSEPAYTGKMAQVMGELAAHRNDAALALAWKWRGDDPGDILALVALGEALEARGDKALAARAYGSIIDLYPSRADMRRFAGQRLERLGREGLTLAADSYAHAVEQRPDHPASHRLRGYALLRLGDYSGAFAALEAGAGRQYPIGRFREVARILREDLGLIGAAWIKKDPKVQADVKARLGKLGAELPEEPSLRFVLTWETDANDVDFHIHDGRGGHAFYATPALLSGGELYADVTTGYGPECFTIPGKPTSYPYKFEAHYYSRGPMGYGMGKLEIIEHDGAGGLKFEERPFVIMSDHAYVNLGTLTGPLK
jgi:hypothetical protein